MHRRMPCRVLIAIATFPFARCRSSTSAVRHSPERRGRRAAFCEALITVSAERELEERVGGRVGDISSCCLCEVFVESLRLVRELIADCAGCSAALTLCAQRNSRSVFSPISTLKGHVTDQTPRTLTDASSSIIFEKQTLLMSLGLIYYVEIGLVTSTRIAIDRM